MMMIPTQTCVSPSPGRGLTGEAVLQSSAVARVSKFVQKLARGAVAVLDGGCTSSASAAVQVSKRRIQLSRDTRRRISVMTDNEVTAQERQRTFHVASRPLVPPRAMLVPLKAPPLLPVQSRLPALPRPESQQPPAMLQSTTCTTNDNMEGNEQQQQPPQSARGAERPCSPDACSMCYDKELLFDAIMRCHDRFKEAGWIIASAEVKAHARQHAGSRTPHELFVDRTSRHLRLFQNLVVLLLVVNAAIFGCAIASVNLALPSVGPIFGGVSASIAMLTLSASSMFACTIALIATCRLKLDLFNSETGEATPAQQMVEFFFWTELGSLLCQSLVSIFMLSQAPSGLASFNAFAATSSAEFVDYSEMLGYNISHDSNDGDALGHVGQRLVLGSQLGAGLVLLACSFAGCVLVLAAEIVTTYRLMMHMLGTMSILGVLVGFSLFFEGVSMLVIQSTLESHGLHAPQPLVITFRVGMAFSAFAGVLVFPFGLYGRLMHRMQDYRRCLLFSTSARAASASLILPMAMGLAVACGAFDAAMQNDCHTLVRVASKRFLGQLANGCDKYYGKAHVLDVSGALLPSPLGAVGDVVVCNRATDAALAWEYTTSACVSNTTYGCLNVDVCCSALRSTMRSLGLLIFASLFAASVILVLSSGSARYIAQHYLGHVKNGVAVVALSERRRVAYHRGQRPRKRSAVAPGLEPTSPPASPPPAVSVPDLTQSGTLLFGPITPGLSTPGRRAYVRCAFDAAWREIARQPAQELEERSCVNADQVGELLVRMTVDRAANVDCNQMVRDVLDHYVTGPRPPALIIPSERSSSKPPRRGGSRFFPSPAEILSASPSPMKVAAAVQQAASKWMIARAAIRPSVGGTVRSTSFLNALIASTCYTLICTVTFCVIWTSWLPQRQGTDGNCKQQNQVSSDVVLPPQSPPDGLASAPPLFGPSSPAPMAVVPALFPQPLAPWPPIPSVPLAVTTLPFTPPSLPLLSTSPPLLLPSLEDSPPPAWPPSTQSTNLSHRPLPPQYPRPPQPLIPNVPWPEGVAPFHLPPPPPPALFSPSIPPPHSVCPPPASPLLPSMSSPASSTPTWSHTQSAPSSQSHQPPPRPTSLTAPLPPATSSSSPPTLPPPPIVAAPSVPPPFESLPIALPPLAPPPHAPAPSSPPPMLPSLSPPPLLPSSPSAPPPSTTLSPSSPVLPLFPLPSMLFPLSSLPSPSLPRAPQSSPFIPPASSPSPSPCTPVQPTAPPSCYTAHTAPSLSYPPLSMPPSIAAPPSAATSPAPLSSPSLPPPPPPSPTLLASSPAPCASPPLAGPSLPPPRVIPSLLAPPLSPRLPQPILEPPVASCSLIPTAPLSVSATGASGLTLGDLLGLRCNNLHPSLLDTNATLVVSVLGGARLLPEVTHRGSIICVPASCEQHSSVRCMGALRAFLDHGVRDHVLPFVPSCPQIHEVPLRLILGTDAIHPSLLTSTALVHSVRDTTVDRREFRGRVHEWRPRAPDAHRLGERGCPSSSRRSCQRAATLTPLRFSVMGPENNLGGKGPASGPPTIRLRSVTTLADGCSNVDMIVTVVDSSRYRPHDVRQNTIRDQHLLQLNVREGTSVDIELAFIRAWYPSTNILPESRVTLGQLRLDILDLDGSEHVISHTPPEAYATVTDAEISTYTDASNNATMFEARATESSDVELIDAASLTTNQRAHGVALTYRNQSIIRLRLGAASTSVDGVLRGRNFLMYGSASAVQPPCLQVNACLHLRYRAPSGNVCEQTTCEQIEDGGQYVLQASMGLVEEGHLVLRSQDSTRSLEPVQLSLPLRVPAASSMWTRRPSAYSSIFPHSLDTAWLVPTGQSRASVSGKLTFVSGSIASQKLVWTSSYLSSRAGTVTVSVYQGMHATQRSSADATPIATVVAQTDGHFALPYRSLLPGMYTLRIAAEHFQLASDAFHVLWNDHALELTLLVVAIEDEPLGPDDRWLAILTWNSGAALRLFLSFGVQNSHCEVFSGREECNGVQWRQASLHSELLELPHIEHLQDMHYAFYVAKAERRCEGFGLDAIDESTDSLSASTNCWGDPASGDGYCYSSPDARRCIRCRLWPSGNPTAAGERICSNYGRPQGGYLRGAPGWRNHGGNNAAWDAFDVSRRTAIQHLCSAVSEGQMRAHLSFVRGQELIYSFPLALFDEDETGTSQADWQRVSCASSSGLLLSQRSKLMDGAAFVFDRSQPSAACGTFELQGLNHTSDDP